MTTRAEYVDIPEIVPGVFVECGEAIYIVDEEGEVMSWNADEVMEDSHAFTAAVNAAILATKHGPEAVRANISDHGVTLEDLVVETGKEMERRQGR